MKLEGKWERIITQSRRHGERTQIGKLTRSLRTQIGLISFCKLVYVVYQNFMIPIFSWKNMFSLTYFYCQTYWVVLVSKDSKKNIVF